MRRPIAGDDGPPEDLPEQEGGAGTSEWADDAVEHMAEEHMADVDMADEMAHGASAFSPTSVEVLDEGNGFPVQGASQAVSQVEAERDDYLDSLRRLQADFENYKKRVHKQQSENLERAAEGLVSKLLGVLDTLDLALAHAAKEEPGQPDVETRALAQVSGMLNEVLGREGLERIDPLGEEFDPTEHDAVLHEEGEGPPRVSEMLRAGYRWKGRVLRPAMVKVTG
ncbi:MAG: nucleotide exchange factor GrpE [Acidimicrobiales bacterium]|nr:MAG: nucleotide exchange factor GrpE [Acidimicrobiales bacterium]